MPDYSNLFICQILSYILIIDSATNVKWNDAVSQRKFGNTNAIKQGQYSQYALKRKTVEFGSDIFHQKVP